MTETNTGLQASYDQVAEKYAEEYFDELARKPADCQMLDAFAAALLNQGEVCEIGCGPGQVARYLKDRGVNMRGLDLSAAMVNCAQRLNPDISFAQGNMLALAAADNSWAGIVSFYAIIHLHRDDWTAALKEMKRVLEPGGHLLLSFHAGEGELHRDQWYGQAVSIDVTLITGKEMLEYLKAAGLNLERTVERAPYDFEYPTRRVYVWASKPKV